MPRTKTRPELASPKTRARRDRAVDATTAAAPAPAANATAARGAVARRGVGQRPAKAAEGARSDQSIKTIPVKTRRPGRGPAAKPPATIDRRLGKDEASTSMTTISRSVDRLAQPRAGSKQALVLSMLARPTGASLDELIEATGWLAHTTRAALTGLRKKGFAIERRRDDGASRYRLLAGAAA